jgi:hypothetical protein
LRVGEVSNPTKYWSMTSETSKAQHDVTVSSSFTSQLVA